MFLTPKIDMHPMIKKRFYLFGLIAAALLTAGCAALVAGTATGVGVYSYMNGELWRGYQAGFEEAVAGTQAALKEMKLRVTEAAPGSLEARFKARRPDGKPVAVTVTREKPNITRIGVRSGLVGVWDKDYSERVHGRIAEQLR